MLAKDKATVKKHRAFVRQLIKKLLADKQFTGKRSIKFGPRFYVAHGKYKNTKSLFKICLYPKSYDHLTNEKFSREILFLNFIQRSKYPWLRACVPIVYESKIGVRAWYIREFLSYQAQNINNGNIRFKDNFFNQSSLNWFIKTFSELQKIKAAELPANFKKLLFPPQTLEYLWKFISPYSTDINRFTKRPGLINKIHEKFIKHSDVYKTAPPVLAHQEVYSPHILTQNGKFKLIDWENIGWALPTHDIVTIWMRAHRHPVWQKKLKKYFFEENKKTKNFQLLWNITVVLQSTFNIISYHHYHDKKDFLPLAKYSAAMLKKLIK